MEALDPHLDIIEIFVESLNTSIFNEAELVGVINDRSELRLGISDQTVDVLVEVLMVDHRLWLFSDCLHISHQLLELVQEFISCGTKFHFFWLESDLRLN